MRSRVVIREAGLAPDGGKRSMTPTYSRSFWWVLAAVVVALHVAALAHSEHLLRQAHQRRADLLLETLVMSAEQTLQASHYLEERIRERLRAIAAEVIAHPERRDPEALRQLQARHDVRTIAVYDARGQLIAASNGDGLAVELPHSFGCHDLLAGTRSEHTFGFSDGIFCEADAFGFAQRLPEGGLVRILTDVGFVLGFESQVGLPALIERFRKNPDVRMLDLVDPAGRPILPASATASGEPAGAFVSGRLTLHGKTAGFFRLVLLDQGVLAMRRTAVVAIGASLGLGLLVLLLARWRYQRQAEIEKQYRVLQDLERQSAGLAHVVAGVAHEIRNPLNTMALALDSVRAETVDAVAQPSAKLVARLDLLRKTVAETNGLIQNLLQTTRPILAQARPVAVAGWLADLKVAFETGFPQATLVTAGPDVTIETDPALLQRLLLNLMGNAAQAGARRVSVTMTQTDDGCRWTIADDGPGLPAQVLEHLFLPGNTTRPEGSGLGLYNARRMAVAMGGRLTLSRTEATGTCFDLELPARFTKDSVS